MQLGEGDEETPCECMLHEDALALEQSIEGFGAESKLIPRVALLRDLKEILRRYYFYTGSCEDCGGEK